jgi:hypothetical protein
MTCALFERLPQDAITTATMQEEVPSVLRKFNAHEGAKGVSD